MRRCHQRRRHRARALPIARNAVSVVGELRVLRTGQRHRVSALQLGVAAARRNMGRVTVGVDSSDSRLEWSGLLLLRVLPL